MRSRNHDLFNQKNRKKNAKKGEKRRIMRERERIIETLLVPGSLLHGVALRAFGLEDLLPGLWIPGGGLRERRH